MATPQRRRGGRGGKEGRREIAAADSERECSRERAIALIIRARDSTSLKEVCAQLPSALMEDFLELANLSQKDASPAGLRAE